MNCMEFRRAALANPLHPGHEALDHEADCPDCTHFYQALRVQEERLYEAMNVPVPEGLADRILLRHQRLRQPHWPWLAGLALTASLLLAVALNFDEMLPPHELTPEMLAAGLITHVAEEKKALLAQQVVPSAQLVSLFARNGVELDKPPGITTYADHCPLPGGGSGEHLVFATPQGKLTLILMPNKHIDHPLRLDKDGLTVSLIPTEAGSMALVSEQKAQIDAAETWARENLRWTGNRA
jgi:hypothetical protein